MYYLLFHVNALSPQSIQQTMSGCSKRTLLIVALHGAKFLVLLSVGAASNTFHLLFVTTCPRPNVFSKKIVD